MCGIVGWVSWEKKPEIELIKKMNSMLTHRGPDAAGIYTDGPVALGHRRLSVIDVDEKSNQPMKSRCNRHIITFNGEIYNFRELRRELVRQGSCFNTSSDTEVVLEAFKTWGRNCLERLEGMFAFAIWSSQTQELFLARDRLGEKPLFYSEIKGRGMVFASELKALRVNPYVSREIDLDALAQYITTNYVSGERSMIKGVFKLLPGRFLIISRFSSIKTASYWDLAYSFNQPKCTLDADLASEQLRSLIDDSVRERLVSDVPVGAFLSGGIDSSAIVASMCRTLTPGSVKTFCAGFEEKGYSEVDGARRVADVLGVSHHEIRIGQKIQQDIERILLSMDEPVADTSFIPFYYLAEFACKSVKVALSGDGGDELLGGYETYTADRLKSRLKWVPALWWETANGLMKNFLPVSHDKVSFDYKLRKFVQGQNLGADQAHLFWRTIYDDKERIAILNDDIAQEIVTKNPFEFHFSKFAEVPRAHYLDRAMYVDLRTWLPDDILAKSDRASMAHSLESRSPFLDRRIVEFCAALPVELKIRGMKKKYLLKQSQRSRLPKSVLKQRKKGFNAPLAQWLNADLKDIIYSATLDKNVAEYVDTGAVKKLWLDHERMDADNSLKLFGIACFSFWLNTK